MNLAGRMAPIQHYFLFHLDNSIGFLISDTIWTSSLTNRQSRASTSAPEWIAMDMGYFYPFMTMHLNAHSMERPMMVPRLANAKEQFLLKPLVETECQKVNQSNDASLVFPHDKLWKTPGSSYEEVVWPIPDDSWRQALNTSFNSTYVKFDWVDLQSYSQHPSIGAIITTPTAIVNESGFFQGSNIHACSINARWIPADLRFDPLVAAVRSKFLQCLDYSYQTLLLSLPFLIAPFQKSQLIRRG